MWFLNQEILEILSQYADYQISDDRLAKLEARYTLDGGDRSNRLLSINGKVANIDIKGVLTKTPNFIAMLFGGGNTTYGEIENALITAANSSDVEEIQLTIDSGGGTVAGLFDVIGTLQQVKTKKPLTAIVEGMAASAAYAVASQADKIYTKNKGDMVGSIGVAVDMPVRDNVVTITSSKAPQKRPDVKTEGGVKMVQERLDAVHDLFVEAIAEGRGVGVDRINAEFGQGATFLAEEALKRGMVDQVGVKNPDENRTVTETAETGGETIEVNTMTLEELKAKHPEAFTAAFNAGAAANQDRVIAHLKQGKNGPNAMKVAIEAIETGAEWSASYQSEYMTALAKDALIADTDADTADDAAGGQKQTSETDEEAEAMEVAKQTAEFCGVELQVNAG